MTALNNQLNLVAEILFKKIIIFITQLLKSVTYTLFHILSPTNKHIKFTINLLLYLILAEISKNVQNGCYF